MRIQVIVVAGGAGSRLKAKLPKALVLLKGKPMVAWSLAVFERSPLIASIVVVGHGSYLKEFNRIAKGYKKIKAVVEGGARRTDSVRLGLAALERETTQVLVHDAARPLIDGASLKRLVEALKRNKAAILAIPVKPTIKRVDPKTLCVKETLERNLLWEVQTPQGFDRKLLDQAHQQKFKGEATDDAMLVEHMGVKVKVVMGNPKNIKVTTPEDLEIAKGWL